MPSEIRHIVFTPVEIIAALDGFLRSRGQPLPTGAVLKIEIEPGEPLLVNVTVTTDLAVRIATLHFAEAEVAAALLNYCRDYRIPLPGYGAKHLHRVGRNLALSVTLNRGIYQIPSVAYAR